MFDAVISVLFSIVDVLKTSFLVSIPVFFAVFAASLIFKKISEKYSLKWLQSAVFATYLTMFILIFFLYAVPLVLSFMQTFGSASNPQFPPTIWEQISFLTLSLLKIIFSSLVFSLLLLPVEFFGLFVFEKFAKKNWHFLLKLFIAVFVSTMLVLLLILFNPWILSGLLYLIFWS